MAERNRKLFVEKRKVIISVFGAAKVGKTSISTQLLEKTFIEKHVATVEDVHHATFQIGKLSNFQLMIKDTTGSYQFPAMRRLAIEQSDGIALVYSDDCKESFKYVEEVIREINDENKKFNVPVVVVRNKIDNDFIPLKPEYAKQRNIVCSQWKAVFIETSTRKNINIDAIFIKMIKAIYPDIVQADPTVHISISKTRIEKRESGTFELFKKRCIQFVKSLSEEKSDKKAQ